MYKSELTDAEVEVEIRRLSESEYVKLARKEQRLKYQFRQKLYTLRSLEKRGKKLADEGITLDNMAEKLYGEVGEEYSDIIESDLF